MSEERQRFIERFGDVFEHSPWIAAAAWEAGAGQPPLAAATLHAAMCRALRAADPARQLALIRAHPDLAGRLALAGGLTAASTGEQASAGLDRLTPDELARFTALNDAYKAKFGFPFVMAIRGRGKEEILAAFNRRLEHDAAGERATALAEIETIARLRLDAMLGG